MLAGHPLPHRGRSQAGHVLIWTGEDDPADTLVPRLAYAGADLRKVHFVQGIRDVDGVRSFDPATDVGHPCTFYGLAPVVRGSCAG